LREKSDNTAKKTWTLFNWTRDSSILLGIFFLTIGLIIYVWWPLAEELLAYVDWSGAWWLYMDWLLLGIFFFMSIAIVSHANLARDSLTILVATLGGLAIESWGTQTNLWHYYTAERPPLWIIPAWPIATLTITRMVRLLKRLTSKAQSFSFLSSAKKFRNLRLFVFNSKTLYRIIFPAFYALMLAFVAPTLEKTYTLLSLLLVALLILTPVDYRTSLLIFLAGAGLGYFLELWGTTRECWTYYTNQKPPLFAVLAHGMAAVAFWRTELLLKKIWLRLAKKEIA
jgi:hypothetical protein